MSVKPKRYKCKIQPRDTIAVDVLGDIVCFDITTVLGCQQIVLTERKTIGLLKFIAKELGVPEGEI